MGQSPGEDRGRWHGWVSGKEICIRSCWEQARIVLHRIWENCCREARCFLIKDILKVLFLPMHIMSGSPHWSIWDCWVWLPMQLFFITALQTLQEEFSRSIVTAYLRDTFPDQPFSRVLNAPLFFLILGLCEAAARGEKTKTNQMDTDEELLEAI